MFILVYVRHRVLVASLLVYPQRLLNPFKLETPSCYPLNSQRIVLTASDLENLYKKYLLDERVNE